MTNPKKSGAASGSKALFIVCAIIGLGISLGPCACVGAGYAFLFLWACCKLVDLDEFSTLKASGPSSKPPSGQVRSGLFFARRAQVSRSLLTDALSWCADNSTTRHREARTKDQVIRRPCHYTGECGGPQQPGPQTGGGSEVDEREQSTSLRSLAPSSTFAKRSSSSRNTSTPTSTSLACWKSARITKPSAAPLHTELATTTSPRNSTARASRSSPRFCRSPKNASQHCWRRSRGRCHRKSRSQRNSRHRRFGAAWRPHRGCGRWKKKCNPNRNLNQNQRIFSR